jgi:O-antigen chain-terminating methyltransferase
MVISSPGRASVISPLRQEFTQQLNRGIDPLRQELQGLRAQFTAEKAELLDVIQRQRSRERDIRRLIYALETTSGKTAEELERTPADEARSSKETEFDYFVFEDRYRGNEDLIRQRQLDYLPYYQGRSNVVDIGCGRGEFLELLRDNGITARGVELGLDQYLLCREKGLDVVRQDLFSFLESLPDESLGGLFSAQVIEHLSAKDQLRYVALAYQNTSPGSPIIFETINALCLFAVLNNYLLDPTHVRLVHPQMLKFAMESMKFRDVELKFMSPVEDRKLPPVELYQHPLEQDRFNVALDQLNDLIYGNQDFAAIGWH